MCARYAQLRARSLKDAVGLRHSSLSPGSAAARPPGAAHRRWASTDGPGRPPRGGGTGAARGNAMGAWTRGERATVRVAPAQANWSRGCVPVPPLGRAVGPWRYGARSADRKGRDFQPAPPPPYARGWRGPPRPRAPLGPRRRVSCSRSSAAALPAAPTTEVIMVVQPALHRARPLHHVVSFLVVKRESRRRAYSRLRDHSSVSPAAPTDSVEPVGRDGEDPCPGQDPSVRAALWRRARAHARGPEQPDPRLRHSAAIPSRPKGLGDSAGAAGPEALLVVHANGMSVAHNVVDPLTACPEPDAVRPKPAS